MYIIALVIAILTFVQYTRIFGICLYCHLYYPVIYHLHKQVTNLRN